MKLKCKYCLSVTILIFLCFIIKNWYFGLNIKNQVHPARNIKKILIKTIEFEEEVTLVLRYNRDSSKQVTITVNSFLTAFPSMSIIIVSDNIIPREVHHSFLNTSGITNIPLKLDLLNLMVDRNVANYIKTKYMLVVPPGVMSLLQHEGFSLIKLLNKSKSDFLAVPVNNNMTKCLKLNLNLLQWLIVYKITSNNSECNSIKGDHGILMHTKTLRKIGEPFLLPFPEALYIQTTSLNLKVKLINTITLKIKEKNAQKLDFTYKNQIQRQIMNKQLKIKKVIREDRTIEWYGCTRNTPRCFPNVINSIPEYINQGRWTPPCCLRVLRETVHHVFKILKDWNVTFWLEGGSLLGAMRMKDIIPWDYDVDIGIYQEDIDKCPWLHMVHLGKFKVGS